MRLASLAKLFAAETDREAGQIAYSMSDEAIDAVQTYLIKIQAKKIEKVETAV